MLKREEVKDVLEVALLAGRIMLENGAETYRVEGTINRICLSRHLIVENFTIPTGIFLSCQYENEYYPYVIRTKSMTIDLEIIAKVNEFSRKFVNSEMKLDEAKNILEDIKRTPHYHPIIYSLFGGFAGGFFTMCFGGIWLEGILAFLTSSVVVTVVKMTSKYMGSFVKNIIGGMINTILAIILITFFSKSFPTIQLANVVIGSIMPLVPGVAMTNAFRDSISGDFVSGVSKLTEALMIAVAIALGVGVVLHLKVLMTGSV